MEGASDRLCADIIQQYRSERFAYVLALYLEISLQLFELGPSIILMAIKGSMVYGLPKF